MTPFRFRARVVVLICAVLTAVPSFAQSITQPKQGQGGSVVKGAAGTEARTGDKGSSTATSRWARWRSSSRRTKSSSR